jgi:hypothetical protein
MEKWSKCPAEQEIMFGMINFVRAAMIPKPDDAEWNEMYTRLSLRVNSVVTAHNLHLLFSRSNMKAKPLSYVGKK